MNYEQAKAKAIEAAQVAIVEHYDAARAALGHTGAFGKDLDRKARKLALEMGGFELPNGWTISMVTPRGWAGGLRGYRGRSARDMLP